MFHYNSLLSALSEDEHPDCETMDLSEAFASSYISFGLNNIVARETRAEQPGRTASRAQTKSRIGRLASGRSRSQNPGPGLTRAVGRRSLTKPAKMARKITEHNYSFSLPFSALQCPESKKKPLSARRKFVVPGSVRHIMSAGHHPRVDSPTIPGRFPLHERSASAPEEPTTSILPVSSSTPPAPKEPCILFPSRDEDIRAAAAAINDRLKPFGAGTLTVYASSSAIEKGPATLKPLQRDHDGTEEKPPVPPKSPSLALRLPTAQQQRQFASRPDQPSNTKVALRIDTSMSRTGSLAKTGHIINQERRTEPRPRASTSLGIFPKVARAAQPHKRSESALGTLATAKPTIIRKPAPTEPQTQENEAPVTSVMNRGRPNRRFDRQRETFLQRETAAERVSFAPLPSGFDVGEAKEKLQSAEVDRLHRQARNQAQKFKVLKYSDVRLLSLELRVCDERYEYLRNTHKTLRLGRSHLHERMIAFLRSSRSTANFREIMLRQEKALAELDHTIDEWYIKLEEVDNRRSRVRQKLLEHIAGALIMSASSSPPPSSPSQLRQQTPPQSPAIPEPDVARESIKIYAESGVFADVDIEDLLADIERQMEDMDSSRDQSPSS